jgi:parvulin-like peptidyl-prolyl isomerase
MGTMGPARQEVPEPPDYSACVAHSAAGARGQSPAQLKQACQGRYEELLRTALNLLIRARWLTLQAREDGLRVDEAALDKEITRGLQLAAQVHQTPTSTGRSLADTKFWARIDDLSNLIYEQIKRQSPQATPPRIAAYYREHKASFAQQERRDLHLIRTDSEASAKKVLGEIRSGRSFASVVKEVSTHQPIHTQDGLILGLTHESYAEPALAHAIFRAKPYVLSGPVRLDATNSPKIAFGYYVFEVTRIHPARQQSLAQAKSGIARNLPEVLRLQALKSYVAAFRKKWRARSDCHTGFVVEDCRQYKRAQPFQDSYTL